MLFDPKYEEQLDVLEERLHQAHAFTPDLISDVITKACTRFATHGATSIARVNRLIEAGAWTDAALAMVELELPSWKLRRLIHEDGEWLCSLSQQPNLPVALDDTAEASHQVLPLAILGAFVEARQRTDAMFETSQAVHQIRPTSGYAVCCDNFT
jgi:hypothetical protein